LVMFTFPLIEWKDILIHYHQKVVDNYVEMILFLPAVRSSENK
jgi:hypothetical protein